MKKLYLDIETLPAEESKKEVLLDVYRRKKRRNKNLGSFEEFIESTGLDGTFGRICCIGYALGDEEVKVLSGSEEKIVSSFWKIAAGTDLFIGFNLIDFDMRFLYQRSIILGIKPTLEVSFARYRSSPMYDVMQEWSRWNSYGRVSLHALSKALDLPSSKEGDIEGKDVAKAYAEGRIKEICDYCARDVELTRKIYKRMTFSS